MKAWHLALTVSAAAIVVGPALSQSSPGSCGDMVPVERGDTLSRIAERCNVTERSLMRLNPLIEGSRDLRVGMQIRARGGNASGSSALDRLGSIADETADTLAGLARDVGSSAQDLLDKNPDLRQRLESFGRRLSDSVSNPDQTRAPVHGTVSVSPAQAAAGAQVNVTAQGLPPDVPVVVGASEPQAAYEVIERARSGPDGRLQVNVRVPDWVSDLSRLVVIVAAEDGAWTLRSAPVQVTGGKL